MKKLNFNCVMVFLLLALPSNTFATIIQYSISGYAMYAPYPVDDPAFLTEIYGDAYISSIEKWLRKFGQVYK